jgi:CSLREA domain-containing protein
MQAIGPVWIRITHTLVVFRRVVGWGLAVLLVLGAGIPPVRFARAETSSSDAIIIVTTTEDELNQDGDCSLREAITAANTNTAVDACGAGGAGMDTIQLAQDASYLLNTIDNLTNGRNALPSVTTAITVQGNGATLERAVNAPNIRMFHVGATAI